MFDGKTMSIDHDGTLILVVNSPEPPANAEWDELIKVYRTHLTYNPSAVLRVIVCSHGGSPSATQRRRMTEALPTGQRTLVAVLTHSLAARAIVTAFRWFYPDSAAFHPGELAAALTHVGASPSESPHIQARLDAMYAQLMRQETPQRTGS